MGIGAREYLAGREIAWPEDRVTNKFSGWVRAFQYSQEFVLYKSGNRVGEVYPAVHETVWFARVYGGHHPREFDTVGEAILYIEAIGALID
jgi:hypothetical protein